MISVLVLLGQLASAQSIVLAERAASHCMFDEALRQLSVNAHADNKSREAQVLRARLLVQLERYEEAERVLEVVPESKVRSEEAERQLVLGLAFQGHGKLSEAKQASERSRQLGGDIDLADGVIAMVLLRQGKLDDAEALLRAVLRRSPTMTGPLYNLGCLMSIKGDVAEAAALIRQAWFYGQQNGDQLKADESLQNVRRVPGLIDDLVHFPIPKCTGW